MNIHTFTNASSPSFSSSLGPIVLLNGWGLTAEVLKPLALALSEITTTLIVDVPYEENVERLCEKIHQQLPDNYILVGWSLGGMLATRLAYAYPESVSALITLATNLQFVNDAEWKLGMDKHVFDSFHQLFANDHEQTLDYFFSLIIKGDRNKRIQRQFLKTLRPLSAQKIQQYGYAGLRLLSTLNNQVIIPAIDCASLHVFAEKDSLVPIALVEQMKHLNPSHRYHILENTGHLLVMPTEQLLAVITPFLVELKHG